MNDNMCLLCEEVPHAFEDDLCDECRGQMDGYIADFGDTD